MRALSILFTSITLLTPAQAFTQALLTPTCSIETAINDIEINNIQIQAKIAKATMPLLDQLQETIAKAADANRPIGEQLSGPDAAHFAEISQRIKQMKLTKYVESSYARDASVIQKMSDAAWKNYSDPNQINDSSDWSVKLLIIMRLLPNTFQWSATKDGRECSIDGVLASQENAAIERASPKHLQMQDVARKIAAIWERNGIIGNMPKDASKLSPDDARSIRILANQVDPTMRDVTLAADLSHIRAWWAICDLEYRDRKEDILDYGDAEHIGSTLNAQLTKMSDAQKGLAKLWEKTDNTILNEEVNLNTSIAESATKDQQRLSTNKRNQKR